MTDFHTHILPEMDDGSKSVQQSVSMLRLEAKQGIDTVCLTPHFYAEQNSPARFLERRERAWRKLKPFLWPELPQLRLGAEVQYFESICEVEDVHKLRIEGTPYLLVEMPFCRWTDRMVEDILELNDHPGTQVVLAHVERYLSMQPNGTVEGLASRGILIQSNLSWFDSWRTRHRAMSMLKNGQIHFLGSDCHNMESRRPNWDVLPPKARLLAEQIRLAEEITV